MASNSVLDNGHQRATAVGIQHRALFDEDAPLDLDRVGRTVTLAWIDRVVAEKIDGLLSHEVGDPEDLALLDSATPWLAWRDDLVQHG